MAEDGDIAVESVKLANKIQDLAVEENTDITAPYSKSFGRILLSEIFNRPDAGKSLVGRLIKIGGWVKTGREAGAGAWCFLEVNDGTCIENLQVVVPKEVGEEIGGLSKLVPTGTCILIEGTLTETPEGTKQAVELKGGRILHLGVCDPSTYPIAKKKTSFEFLREKMHLRVRTNTMAAISRIRNAMAFATHLFFQKNGFYYVNTAIISASDCEGAGEMFEVTWLLSKAEKKMKEPMMSEEDILKLGEMVQKQGDIVADAKKAAAGDKENPESKALVKREVEKLMQLKTDLENSKSNARYIGGIARCPDGSIDYSEDFFGKPAFLQVSGQLQAEYYACAMSNVYTFGPTFRAEWSHTSRHLAEFWMIEPEMAFCTLEDDMQCAEDYVRFCCKYALDNVRKDLEFLTKFIDKGAIDRLEKVSSTNFARVSYTECIEILKKDSESKKKTFKEQVEWGSDLQSEHERYLCEEVFKMPIIVYNYPKEIKAFYMKLNSDGKTVAAMDVLVPQVGELIGGSQREDNYEVLRQRIVECGMKPEDYEGYLDLRKYGSVPHSGFGLGFERLILFATGMSNIRDVIPFPRYPGNALY